jgi:transposase
MPRVHSTLNLPGFSITKTSGSGLVIANVSYKHKPCCIHCKSDNLRLKDSFDRTIRHESIGLRQVALKLTVNKYYCRECHKYFRQRFPGILPYKRSTEALRNEVFTLHTRGMSQSDLSQQYRISASTVERWFQDYYRRGNHEIKERDCPRVLGIDEHFFSRKDGYATTFCDLKKHRIFDVVKGRAAADLHEYLMSLSGREKVRVVCMDMSVTYRSIIRKYFPNAKIVADRFHVIRLVNHQFIKTIQTLDPDLKYAVITRLLRTNPENLTPHQKGKLTVYLDKHPAIRALYDFKQQFTGLLMKKRQTQKTCKTLIPQFLSHINQLKESGFAPLRKLAHTVTDWLDEIARMWRFTKSNGITEGFHRKMKLIQRRAYGFRNFENYRLRVRILCG